MADLDDDDDEEEEEKEEKEGKGETAISGEGKASGGTGKPGSQEEWVLSDKIDWTSF